MIYAGFSLQLLSSSVYGSQVREERAQLEGGDEIAALSPSLLREAGGQNFSPETLRAKVLKLEYA